MKKRKKIDVRKEFMIHSICKFDIHYKDFISYTEEMYIK